MIGYHKFFQFCLFYLPQSFSIGEAFLVSQAAALFLYSSSINIAQTLWQIPVKVSHISTTIIQVNLSVCTIYEYIMWITL